MSRTYIFLFIFLLFFPLINGAPQTASVSDPGEAGNGADNADTKNAEKAKAKSAPIIVDKKSGENGYPTMDAKIEEKVTSTTQKPGARSTSSSAHSITASAVRGSSAKSQLNVPTTTSQPIPRTLAGIKKSSPAADISTTTTDVHPSTTEAKKVVSPIAPTTTPHPIGNQTTSIFPTLINPSSIDPSSESTAATNIPTTPKAHKTPENELKKLIENLISATKLWDEINLNNILQNEGVISNETTDQATEAFYNIFKLGFICSNWLKHQNNKKVDNQTIDPLFLKVQNVTQLFVNKIVAMNQEIDNGLIQENIFDPKEMQHINLTLGRKYVNQIIVYFDNLYQHNLNGKGFEDLCQREHHMLIASNALETMNKSFVALEIHNDPMNKEIFEKTANVFIDAMKQFIMINMACDVLPHEEISFRHSVVPFLGKPRNDMNQVFYDIYANANEYNRKLKAFKKYVGSIIDEYLDKYGGESQSAITEKIYNQLTSSSSYAKDYNFAVGVYSQQNASLLTEGDYVFSNYKVTKGKNAFVIANRKSSKSGYKACKFWELKESDVCAQTNKDKFKNIIQILKKHCIGISDIGVIKLTPHLLDGYVSVKFDRESNAFSMSGLGLGDCFHYSIFIANALA